MPINRNAELRLRILDRCFRDFLKEYSFQNLKDRIDSEMCDEYGRRENGISVRQLRQDIRTIRQIICESNSGVELKTIKKTREDCYYRYSERDFSIYDNEMSNSELQNLRSTIQMLGRFKAANPWLEEVISSLEVKFGFRGNSENLVELGYNSRLKGLEYLSTIIDATINHQPLEIRYTTYSGASKLFKLYPYYVKQYNGRWFLLGRNEGFTKITNVALDRIVSISKWDVPFCPNKEINFSTYFDNIVGVTVPEDAGEPEEIRLQFSPQRFPYVVTKPIHPLQNIIERERIVVLRLHPNRELMQLIFSFGPDVEVLQPSSLREQMKKMLESMIKKYSVQQDCIEGQ